MANDEFGQPQSEGQPQAPAAPPINQKHALIGKIFETIAGGERTSYQVNPETGATETVKTPLKPGELWRGILASGLTGLMVGAGERGPGSAGRAFEKGGTAVQAQREKVQQQAREQAQTDFKNRMNLDEITLRKHADARDKMRLDAELKEHTLRLAGLGLENKGRDLEYKTKLINMEQGFADTISRIKLLGGKPAQIAGQDMPEFEGQTADEAINAASDFYKYRASSKDVRNLEFKPVFDPDTGKYQMYVIPDPDRPITKQEAEKINTIYGIKPVAGANTVREVYSWLNRPGAAEEGRKRAEEEARVSEAQSRAQTAAEETKTAKARTAYEQSRIARVQKSDAAYEALADIQLSLDKGEKADPKRLAKARPVIRENLKMWIGEETKRIKDAESGDPEAKEAATEATTQRKKWEDLWDADKGIKPPEEIKPVTIYGPNGEQETVRSDKVTDAIAAQKAAGKGDWSQTKPTAAPSGREGALKAEAAAYKKIGRKVLGLIEGPQNEKARDLFDKPYGELTAEQKKTVDTEIKKEK